MRIANAYANHIPGSEWPTGQFLDIYTISHMAHSTLCCFLFCFYSAGDRNQGLVRAQHVLCYQVMSSALSCFIYYFT